MGPPMKATPAPNPPSRSSLSFRHDSTTRETEDSSATTRDEGYTPRGTSAAGSCGTTPSTVRPLADGHVMLPPSPSQAGSSDITRDSMAFSAQGSCISPRASLTQLSAQNGSLLCGEEAAVCDLSSYESCLAVYDTTGRIRRLQQAEEALLCRLHICVECLLGDCRCPPCNRECGRGGDSPLPPLGSDSMHDSPHTHRPPPFADTGEESGARDGEEGAAGLTATHTSGDTPFSVRTMVVSLPVLTTDVERAPAELAVRHVRLPTAGLSAAAASAYNALRDLLQGTAGSHTADILSVSASAPTPHGCVTAQRACDGASCLLRGASGEVVGGDVDADGHVVYEKKARGDDTDARTAVPDGTPGHPHTCEVSLGLPISPCSQCAAAPLAQGSSGGGGGIASSAPLPCLQRPQPSSSSSFSLGPDLARVSLSPPLSATPPSAPADTLDEDGDAFFPTPPLRSAASSFVDPGAMGRVAAEKKCGDCTALGGVQLPSVAHTAPTLSLAAHLTPATCGLDGAPGSVSLRGASSVAGCARSEMTATDILATITALPPPAPKRFAARGAGPHKEDSDNSNSRGFHNASRSTMKGRRANQKRHREGGHAAEHFNAFDDVHKRAGPLEGLPCLGVDVEAAANAAAKVPWVQSRFSHSARVAATSMLNHHNGLQRGTVTRETESPPPQQSGYVRTRQERAVDVAQTEAVFAAVRRAAGSGDGDGGRGTPSPSEASYDSQPHTPSQYWNIDFP